MYQFFKKDLLYLCAEVGVSAHRAGRVQMKAIDRQMYTKKLPNIQNYQRNVHQKYMLIHFTLVRLAINKREITNAGEDAGGKRPLNTTQGNINQCIHNRNHFEYYPRK